MVVRSQKYYEELFVKENFVVKFRTLYKADEHACEDQALFVLERSDTIRNKGTNNYAWIKPSNSWVRSVIKNV